jgi:sigma-B regulation protein RsbU (phosphoserine phosphatase)
MPDSDPVQPYRQSLDRLRRKGGRGPLLKQVSELVSLLDLMAALGPGTGETPLDAMLRIVTRELRVKRGALFVRDENGELTLRAAHGVPPGAPPTLGGPPPAALLILGPGDKPWSHHGLALLVPIRRRERTIAVLGLGPRGRKASFGPGDLEFLHRVAICAAPAIESDLLHDELREAGRRVSMGAFQLHNLFDISRELTGSFEEKAICDLVATSVMGHFMVSRCALYLLGPAGLSLALHRGLPSETPGAPIPTEDARAALEALAEARAVTELPDGPVRRELQKARLALVVPLAAGTRVEGVLAVGERSSGLAFSAEDRGFARTLGVQALAALENARLLRLREEKLRQDRELQIAREIQNGLFPSRPPEIAGFEVAGQSRSCHEVGGDAYDWMDLGGERLALVIADVSGKGTPASLLMASVHASVRALAGTESPAVIVERLNRFLFASTPANRFVTLFYAELDGSSRRLSYVNAGHVPPYRMARDGSVSRLREGGPALGLLGDAAYEVGVVDLQPGDVVALVTDGVTEAGSLDEREFGDGRVCELLRARSGESASLVLEGLLTAVTTWEGSAGCSDDLTAVVLKAR